MISIIVPTYEERENIKILFDRIDNCLMNIKYEIIVVDDNSTDGTIDEVNKLIDKYPVRLIVRTHIKGLASAVVEGFAHAKGNIFVVMDADLQHPPEKIVMMLDEINKGVDIVIGSRYKDEKGFGNFNPIRKTISKCANYFARILFHRLSNIKDIQSGFFALKRDVINGVNLDPIGYKILLEVLIVGNYYNIKEISFRFAERKNGYSKLGIRIIADYIHHLMRLAWNQGELKRFMKYCIIGSSGIIVNTMILYSFTDLLGIFYLLSSAMAYEASIITNFIMNDKWTFKETIIPGKSHNFFTRAMYFNWTMILGAIYGILLLYVFTEFLLINYIISNLISIAIITIWRYYTSMTVVWRHKI